jgi:signal transduction histidine kinase/CheY-like chemotaxis protein/HPt (histidine-containing phosphotransfer) domain-containing protein
MGHVPARRPENEAARLSALQRQAILDTPPEEHFDRLTRLAAGLLGTRIALISLIDRDRQWFKSRHGLEARETPRDLAFCAHAILTKGPLVVLDATTDPRFSENPLVVGAPGIRFYAGAPLTDRDGLALGTLCVIDSVPRDVFGAREQAVLADLAALVVDELELRRTLAELGAAGAALRRAKEDAEAASAAKGEFLAMISHEMRTPLNGVLGALGLLADAPTGGEERRLIDVARHSAQGLLALISDVLDLTRIENGQLDVEIAAFAPLEIAESVAEMLQGQAQAKGLAFAIRAEPGLPERLTSDPDRIRQVLLNLAANAVKFTASGRVTIELGFAASEAGRGRLRLAVVDTGIGIAESQRALLFQPFAQLDSSRRRRYGGSGLGLAICRRLTELLGGSIGVESAPGQGSRFWVELPVGVAPPARPEAADAAEPETIAGRILLVEDSQTNALVARTLLERKGARVDHVGDGAQALAALQQRPYDLVLMDVAMPEMDGIEATRRIRASAGPQAGLPIIGMSAHALSGDAEACRAAGMDSYLTKPLQRGPFLAAVAAALARRPADAPLVDARQVEEIWGGMEPEVYAEIVQVFLGELEQRLARLARAAAAGESEVLSRQAHAIKGAAANVGALPLSAAAAELERDPGGDDPAATSRRVAALDDLARRTMTALAALAPQP